MYKQNKINMENLKTIQIKDKDYVKVNPDTGEVKDAYVTRKVSMDEFIMLFFNSFPELFKLEGNALKILMCIWKKSSYNPFEDSGNLFYNNKIFKLSKKELCAFVSYLISKPLSSAIALRVIWYIYLVYC